jgi:hypothetical protein
MLKNLFGVDLGEPRPAPTLERLILLWNKIEETLKGKYAKAGIDRGHTFHWEMAMREGLLTGDDAQRLIELRMIRNKQVHSSDIDRKEVEHAVHLAETVLSALNAPL